MKNERLHIIRYILCSIFYASFIVYCSLFNLQSSIVNFQFALPAYAQQDPLTIAVIQPYNIKAYHEAVEEFRKQLGRHFNQELNMIVYESSQGLYTTLAQTTDNSEQPDIDLILTVGMEATSEVSQKITDIPIVFTMVLNPESILNHRSDIVGASLNIPVEYQFNLIKEILPTAKTIGIIYDPKRNTPFVENSASIAEKLDLQIKPFPVESQKDIPEALKRVSQEADVLLGIVDNTVYTSQTVKFIIQDTVKRHVPFIGISVSYVKAGALCALVFDNYDIGRQTAKLAEAILSGTSASELQMTTPERIHLILNLRTAELIGVKIPENIQEQALIVYE